MRRLNKRILAVLLALMLTLTTMPFGALTAQADDLSDAKAAYLAKVTEMYNGTKLYKNSMGAYMAYVEACKDGAGASEAAALAGATAAMEEFVPYTGDVTAKVNNTTATGCYSNVVWEECPTALQYSNLAHGFIYWDNGVLIYHGDWFIYQPSAVLLYDGTTDAKIPVLFAEQENEGNYRFRFGYVAEGGGRLKTDWYGYNTAPRDGTSSAVNVVWPTVSNIATIPRQSTPSSTSDDGYVYFDANVEHSDKSDFYNFKNALTFDIDNGKDYTTVIDKNEYKGIANYKKFSKFEWTVHAYWYNNVTSLIGGAKEHLADGNTELTTSNPVYVLNYKKLLDKIQLTLAEKKDTFLVDNESFRSGNSIGFFGTFDNVLSLDVTDTTKYNYDYDPEAAVKKAGDDINEACIDLDEITSTAAAMSSLVSNINRYEAMMADNPYRYNLADTYKNYLKAKECFDAYIFGQKNSDDDDAEFLDYLARVSNDFDTALSSFTPFASYTVDGQGNKTFTADPIKGNYTPDTDTKIFEGDTNGGTTGLENYTNAGAMNNVVYYPTVTRANGVRAETDTYGNGNKSYTVDGRTMMFNGDGNGTNHFTVYYPEETVLVYNGVSAPAFPVLGGTRNAETASIMPGVENFNTAAYPTDSTTLKDSSDRYMENVNGYKSQTVNGVSYGDGFYPFAEYGVDNASGGYYNTHGPDSDNPGPHAPAESSNFRIKTFGSGYTYDSQSSMLNRYWKGVHVAKDSNNLPLSWVTAWNTDTSGITGSGAMYGSPTEFWSKNYSLKTDDNHNKAEITIAASALELLDDPFTGKTVNDGAAYYTKDYDGPNWYHSWQEVRVTTDLNIEVMLDKGSKIRVLNVIPAMEAKDDLIENNDVQDILGAIFQYDKDSADVIKFLTALDKVGSFDPNKSKYHYGEATSGTPEYSVNAGVEQACKDMVDLVNSTEEALGYIDDSTDSEHSTVNDEKINVPTDAPSKSTDTNDPGTGWYADLRRALIDPLEPDSCTDDEAYAAYKAVLDKAQDAIAYSAMSKIGGGTGSDYEATYNGQTIPEIAAELVAATETFRNAPAMHAYIYEDENEDQISTWDCTANASHNHATADMSAYNELEIAYRLIDREAYKDFDTILGAAYDDGDYTDDASDPTNLSFVETKNRATKKGEAPQAFVDHGVARLLEAINEASKQEAGQESHLNTYRVTFIVKVDGEEPSTVIDNEEYLYNSSPTLDATEALPFTLYGASCYKWSIKMEDGTEQSFRHEASSLACTIKSNCTVTAYATKTPSSGQTKVLIAGPTGATVYGVNVDNNAKITFGEADANGNISITVGTNTYTVKSTSAYKNTAWTIGSKTNETEYSGTSDDYTAGALAQLCGRKELLIYPKTELQATSEYRIQMLGETTGTITSIAKADNSVSESTLVDGVPTLTGVKYDDRVTATFTPDATKGTFYGIVINETEMAGGTVPRYIPISYDNVYSFHANSYMNFYPLYVKNVIKDGITTKVYYVDDGNDTRITDGEALYRLQHHLPFVINLYDTDNVSGKYILRALFTAHIPDSAGVKITEHGRVAFATDNQNAVAALAIGESDCIIGNKWTFEGQEYAVSKKAASKKYDSDSHQFAFSSTCPTSGYRYVMARGYIKYEYDFSQTVIEDGVEKTYTATIEAVEYGRAVTYTYPS